MFEFIFGKRINDHYKVKKHRNGTLTLHHSPKHFFYYLSKEEFFDVRLETYHQIASLQDFRNIKKVVGASVIIDYSLDGFKVENREIRIKDIMNFSKNWLGNAHNWYCSRVSKLFQHICKNNVFVGSMDWELFKSKYKVIH